MGEDYRYKAKHKVRFVTASALFDGHDVSITIMRQILQASGAEVIHLGHNRSALEIVQAAIQEDVQGIAVSSYQGGHVEYFTYMMNLLREKGAPDIKLFGGGGGVILPSEIKMLQEYGVTRIFSPEDGRELGLQGMINFMLQACDFSTIEGYVPVASLGEDGLMKDDRVIARFITAVEMACENKESASLIERLSNLQGNKALCPVVGITGTGGAGKSSLTDELIQRFLRLYPEKTIAILSVDPTKQRSGGALLGDRIRMNAIHSNWVYMRSMATRGSGNELSAALGPAIAVLKAAGFDLILVETSGIGQGDHHITKVADVSLYVMTSEFGAPSQLEKIDMLDYADLIAINKFDRPGSLDALRDVKKQVQRNHGLFDQDYESMPVYGTMASQFNDGGVDAVFTALIDTLNRKCALQWTKKGLSSGHPAKTHVIIPVDRTRYLGEIAHTVRTYHAFVEEEAELASSCYQIDGAIRAMEHEAEDESIAKLHTIKLSYVNRMQKETRELLAFWPELQKMYSAKSFITKVRDKEYVTELTTQSLSGLDIPKISLPKYRDAGDIIRFLYRENVPGEFPFTAGVFAFKRTEEDPKRQFAGEGTPERTNLRFHYLSQNDQAKRLSTAFDSVTLYGEDPDERQDIYGKIGESGVSVCTLDDMKKLYAGFDLCNPMTSVSMTINGPAPILLAMFMNTAIEFQLDLFSSEHGKSAAPEEAEQIRRKTLKSVRGTVQADILKEDQGQNTCIFSTEFALRMMGDIQQYFIDHEVRNYYSVSISGYHIAEAGANPISQLAFTLANGFTYVEYYLSRGMSIDDFAPNLSFFFSNGLDPEYTVIGRVARRIWAAVMKIKYKANERSQKLKYHIQTSGRSLHAQEIDFNDIRTTLQALMAILDNCNSLHTNSYDEAITTPTEESVRRAMAIQLIITKELGFVKNENMLQGSFLIEELTDLVEEAVLQEMERISERGGVLGAMESQYQRGKIQSESMLYEMKKHHGELPIIGVNTFLHSDPPKDEDTNIPLARATVKEKEQQITNLRAFITKHQANSPMALAKLQQVALDGGNIFAELMETVKVASLGQITRALYQVGGQYRRNM